MNAIRVAARRRVALQFAAKDTHRARVSLGIARKSVTSKNPTKKLKKVAAYIKAAPRAAALAKKQRIAALRSAAVDERTARREKKKIALKKKAVEMILKKKAKYKTWKAKVAAIRKRKVARKAATKKKRAVKKAIKATGAVRPFTLFVQKTTTDKKGSMSTTDLAVKWKALSEEQQQRYRDEATSNLVKRTAIKQSMKTPTKYALFVRDHFSATYDEVRSKASNNSHKAAFKAASAAVARKYRNR